MEEHYLKLKLPAGAVIFSKVLGHFSRVLEMGLSLVLPSSLKLPLLRPSMDLMNTHNHLYHNPLSKTQTFA
ncbi:unnamed protein product [Prunus armeniaca]